MDVFFLYLISYMSINSHTIIDCDNTWKFILSDNYVKIQLLKYNGLLYESIIFNKELYEKFELTDFNQLQNIRNDIISSKLIISETKNISEIELEIRIKERPVLVTILKLLEVNAFHYSDIIMVLADEIQKLKRIITNLSHK